MTGLKTHPLTILINHSLEELGGGGYGRVGPVVHVQGFHTQRRVPAVIAAAIEQRGAEGRHQIVQRPGDDRVVVGTHESGH